MVLIDLDEETLQFLKKKVEEEKKVREIEGKLQEMLDDLHSMGSEKLREKYKCPQKRWAELQFELYLAKKGLSREEFFEKWRKKKGKTQRNERKA